MSVSDIVMYVFQRVLELEVAVVEHQGLDEVGFNITNGKEYHRAIVDVPGQEHHMCSDFPLWRHGHHHATLGPYNTVHPITFLDTLHSTLIPPDQIDAPEQPRYVVIWENVSFHRAALVHNWFTGHPCF